MLHFSILTELLQYDVIVSHAVNAGWLVSVCVWCGRWRHGWSLQDASHASAGDHLLDCNDPFGDSFLLNHDAARMPISRRDAERHNA